jgi:hypothetical protein
VEVVVLVPLAVAVLVGPQGLVEMDCQIVLLALLLLVAVVVLEGLTVVMLEVRQTVVLVVVVTVVQLEQTAQPIRVVVLVGAK